MLDVRRVHAAISVRLRQLPLVGVHQLSLEPARYAGKLMQACSQPRAISGSYGHPPISWNSLRQAALLVVILMQSPILAAAEAPSTLPFKIEVNQRSTAESTAEGRPHASDVGAESALTKVTGAEHSECHEPTDTSEAEGKSFSKQLSTSPASITYELSASAFARGGRSIRCGGCAFKKCVGISPKYTGHVREGACPDQCRHCVRGVDRRAPI